MSNTTSEIIDKYKTLFSHEENTGNIADNEDRRKLFGSMLAELRRATTNPQTGRFLTQNELAEIVDYKSSMSIQYIETGARPLPKLKICAFAEALNVDYETLWMLTGYDINMKQLTDGARFKLWREQNGKSQREAARELNIATTSLARWENNKGQLSPESYSKLQSVDWIGGGFFTFKYSFKGYDYNSNSISQEDIESLSTSVIRELLQQKIDSLSRNQLEKLLKMIEILED